MKKLFTLFALLQMVVTTWAQQIPNSGFEQWTSSTNPDMWSTVATSLPFPGLDDFAIKDLVNHTEGLASIKLTTDTFTYLHTHYTYASQVGLGTGTFVSGQGIYFSGISYTQRITTLKFKYMYSTPRSAIDSGLMQLDLRVDSTSILHNGLGWHMGATNGNWDSAFFLLDSTDYSNTRAPDTLKLVFYSSTSGGGTDPLSLGSILWIDDIKVTTPTSSIADFKSERGGVNIYPNPALDMININIGQNETGSKISLYDMLGREVYKGTIDRSGVQINASSWPAGTYTISIKSTDRITTYEGKVIVQH